MPESLQQIKGRIKSVKNINQITKAMELVAATKMRRSQEIALASRPYAFGALEFLATLAKLDGVTLPPLLVPREIKKRMIVLITSDKGLAGAFNANVIRAFDKWYRKLETPPRGESSLGGKNEKSGKTLFIGIGQKAAQHLEKFVSLKSQSSELKANFIRVGDYTTVDETKPIADLIIQSFLGGECDEVIIFSTHFRSALTQEVLERRVLPVSSEDILKTLRELIPEHGRFSETQASGFRLQAAGPDYLIEPSAEELLDHLARHLILMEMYHIILEANASEHAARRLAMKNASDNAEELSSDLSLLYNKSRQAAITKEIIEITAGAESLT